MASLRELVAKIWRQGRLRFLLFSVGIRPIPHRLILRFAEHLEKVAFRAHCSLHSDETSEHCHWHIPEAHSLEAWSDARAYDGTVSIIQPLIAPLYGGKSLP